MQVGYAIIPEQVERTAICGQLRRTQRCILVRKNQLTGNNFNLHSRLVGLFHCLNRTDDLHERD